MTVRPLGGFDVVDGRPVDPRHRRRRSAAALVVSTSRRMIAAWILAEAVALAQARPVAQLAASTAG